MLNLARRNDNRFKVSCLQKKSTNLKKPLEQIHLLEVAFICRIAALMLEELMVNESSTALID